MTYCLGIILPTGLLLASDSRSSAGVDQIALVAKLNLFEVTGERVITILCAGNLATTQAVVTNLRQKLETDGKNAATKSAPSHLLNVRTMFDAAKLVGDELRRVIQENKSFVQAYGDPDASFLVGGQIRGEGHRLFQIYSAGNFVEASTRTRFFQLGETKYGKPILDRALKDASSLDEAGKLALLSFDATIRSNLSVAPPIDMLRYETNSLSGENLAKFDAENPYWNDLRHRYSEGLSEIVKNLPAPTRNIFQADLI